MPRLTASSANSWWVQCVTGRSLSAGGSQAMATIAQICSAVKVAGVPGRGASASRWATRPLLCAQRRRQCCTVERAAPSRRTLSRTSSPAAAASNDPLPAAPPAAGSGAGAPTIRAGALALAHHNRRGGSSALAQPLVAMESIRLRLGIKIWY